MACVLRLALRRAVREALDDIRGANVIVRIADRALALDERAEIGRLLVEARERSVPWCAVREQLVRRAVAILDDALAGEAHALHALRAERSADLRTLRWLRTRLAHGTGAPRTGGERP